MKLQRYKKFYYNGQIEREEYYLNGRRHNPDGPACKYWYDNGQIEHEAYWLNGEFHNPDGLASKSWYKNGQKKHEAYYLNGVHLTKKEFDELKSKIK